jgi:hypothetical protein
VNSEDFDGVADGSRSEEVREMPGIRRRGQSGVRSMRLAELRLRGVDAIPSTSPGWASEIDSTGAERAATSVDNTGVGHAQLVGWLNERGAILRCGMELLGGSVAGSRGSSEQASYRLFLLAAGNVHTLEDDYLAAQRRRTG